jgi:deoxycytidylate deaminase
LTIAAYVTTFPCTACALQMITRLPNLESVTSI